MPSSPSSPSPSSSVRSPATRRSPTPRGLAHGSLLLPSVRVDGYSLQLRKGNRFLGDSVSRQAFGEMLDAWRALIAAMDGRQPLGRKPAADIDKDRIDEALRAKTSPAGAAIHAAIEDYALQLAHVVPRFLRHTSWKGVQRIVVGGGFADTDHGHRAIHRAAELLQQNEHPVELCTLHHHPDEGGLIGWVHLAPPALMRDHDALLAVDIGGTNARCGIVCTRTGDAADMSKAEVLLRDKWAHGDDDEVTRREHMLQGIADMLAGLVRQARKEKLRLAPFVGVACPGLIREDGCIGSGTQNLPGDWESEHFHLPSQLAKRLAEHWGAEPLVCLHNDAVVQGLSQLPFMQDVQRWAVLTVGTGLGNASYTNRARPRPASRKPRSRKT